ncbi:hypothetical protein [Cryobacterium psychrophilum]|uniref:Uncharacterized protein n=1 Tax=Cryobacterium psychrophilum TaxID=41988 RepID=A0A4Y8KKP3_9MICO|nr:hypothetical protein [Cryobacterium psychrophilum]TDW30168.1 hypothetical protein EDD25_1911 [Cryobacterium psychrophilum]TFD77398.1 hypothetical protein E3T53_11265 [Cryobacterium psychrophilum]
MYLMTDLLGSAAADPIPGLRQQRALLDALRDDVQAAWRSLSADDVTDTWRGRAQQGYLDRLESLRRDVHALARLLDDALREVALAIDLAHAGL